MGKNKFSSRIFRFTNSKMEESFNRYLIEHQTSQQDFLNWLVSQYLSKQLTSTNSPDFILQQQKIKLNKQKIAKNVFDTKISKSKSVWWDAFGTPPSERALDSMKIHANTTTKKIVQPNGSFHCPRCDRVFAESEIYKQVDKLYNHMKNDHDSEYTELERNEILQVIEK